MANSADSDEMPHNEVAAFYQGLYYLLRQNQSSEKELKYFLKSATSDHIYIYTMDHPDLFLYSFKVNFIVPKRVKHAWAAI